MFDYQNYQKDYYIKNIRKFREYYHDNKDSIAGESECSNPETAGESECSNPVGQGEGASGMTTQ
jgi:hypothetical protein